MLNCAVVVPVIVSVVVPVVPVHPADVSVVESSSPRLVGEFLEHLLHVDAEGRLLVLAVVLQVNLVFPV